MTQQNALSFKSVRHGYDPTEVDRHVSELAKSASEAQQRADGLAEQLERLNNAESVASDKPMPPAEPTFHDFGKRIGRILAMAEEEAEEMRGAAVAEVDARLAEADEAAAKARREADEYARETRTAADDHAGKLIEDAKRAADQMADEAERMAIARSGEAEALYEEQRARAAKAAADFEQTLAERRETAEQQFQERAEMAEKELEAARNRVAKLRAEGDQLQAESARRAQQMQADAERKAEQVVADAMERADRIRAESERELSAATQRRNAINAQLTNVRQMLATLSGTAGAAVTEEAAPEPRA
jgi:chromosome segregation ATPase